MMLGKVSKFIISVLLCEFAGIVGALFTSPAIPAWYASLTKPALNPPGWVFGPVWTALYFLMGVGLYLVWEGGGGKRAVFVFSVQLILNAVWSVIFFGAKNPGLAFLDIILLWFAIFWTIKVFHKISRQAAYLLLPYILWVSFAAYLNYSVWMLN